ncbi:MAG: DUF3592 domain-containing protein [Deltaproteobacteria bacterium]|nr:MAG: DUF3592 domain-containing protein [Deltaproteobacteria bacterium]
MPAYQTGSDRTKPIPASFKRLGILWLVLLPATALWEHRDARRYGGTTVGRIAEFTRARHGGLVDGRPPRIEYAVGEKRFTIVRPRAVFDLFRLDEIGDPVPVRYDPEHPGDAVIDLPWYRYPVTAAFSALGLLFLASVFVVWFRRRAQVADHTRRRGRAS